MDALQQHIDEMGLSNLLEPEFFSALRDLGDCQLIVLVATLGTNSPIAAATYRRWLAAYQFLANVITARDAADLCVEAGYSDREFYVELFKAGSNGQKVDSEFRSVVGRDDIEFGIEFLLDAHHPERIAPLVDMAQGLDGTPKAWLNACKKIVQRKDLILTVTRSEKMAVALRRLIEMAPVGQEVIVRSLQAELAEYWLKAREAVPASIAISKFRQGHALLSPQVSVLDTRRRLLAGDLEGAIHSMAELIEHLSENDISELKDGRDDRADVTGDNRDFDPEAAADTLRFVNAALRKKGLRPFLMSGTLLGYLRDGRIMPHDKDVDIGIIGWEHQYDVAQALADTGRFRIDFFELKGNRTFLFAPKDVHNQIAIDIFFYHDKGDHFLHGINFNIGYLQNFRFSKFNLKEIEFLGEKFWIPDNSAQNLSENYGDWQTPLPGYVVTVESPAICDIGGLPQQVSAHLAVLKEMAKKNRPHEKIRRILDYCSTSGVNLLAPNVRYALKRWLVRETKSSSHILR
jgi:hypothetical protein